MRILRLALRTLPALLASLLLLFCAPAFAASTCTQSVFSTSAPVISPTHVGDLLTLVTVTSGGGGSPFVTGIADTQTNTWNQSVNGTFGASSSYFTVNSGNNFVSAFYGYASATTADTVTVTFNGGTPGNHEYYLIDCSGLASSAVLLTNIHNEQAAPGTGANAVTTSGGTGSSTVTLGSAAGALLVGVVQTFGSTPTVSAGTGFTQSIGGFDNGYIVEYQRVTSSGTYDATATLSGAADAVSWMFAFAEPAAAPHTSGFFFSQNQPRVKMPSYSNTEPSALRLTTCKECSRKPSEWYSSSASR